MGGARALRFAERLRLSSTPSVAGGWTMAWSTSRPPQAHARPSTPNTRQRRSAQGCHRDLPRRIRSISVLQVLCLQQATPRWESERGLAPSVATQSPGPASVAPA